MRIVDIKEMAVPLQTNMRNAAFDFSEMTTSVVAVATDVMRAGKRVVGYAFNSTGRYACGAQMRARFIPRVLEGRSRFAPERDRNEFRSRKNPRRDDAAGEAGRTHRALDRHRHDRGRMLGRRRENRRQAVAPRARRTLQQRARDRESAVLCGWRLVSRRQRGEGSPGRNPPPPRRRLHDHEDQGRRRAGA